ncbi:innexin shaking-B-like [Varroa jacobsoni]|uniref:Innexin n=1 Tax=Varroa destructor TaxID=109461 RepID=A0A7M7J6C6_VARDE|nr:innexin shaking-B-like [Varroa destructor]XP_022697489.1 innexin shaking-B-like [Varroa jacobsoni]
MLSLIGTLRGLLKIKPVHIDGMMFRLHHGPTVVLLLAFSVLITTKQYFGDPIDCDVSGGASKSLINVYCWIHATYSVNSLFRKADGIEVVYPGVGTWKGSPPKYGNQEGEYKFHKYYQWVSLMLFFQAILFYGPRWMWKAWEARRLENLLAEREPQETAKAIWAGSFSTYMYRYALCELLCFINVFAQLFMINRFLDGEFFTFGLEVLSFMEQSPEDRVDPMVRVFPRVAKCHFHKFGSSGNVETHDAVCVLPLNIINEKIYVFLWFWMCALLALTTCTILYRLVQLFSGRVFRARLVRWRFYYVPDVLTAAQDCTAGQCFILYMLGRNMETVTFSEMLQELKRLQKKAPDYTLVRTDENL